MEKNFSGSKSRAGIPEGGTKTQKKDNRSTPWGAGIEHISSKHHEQALTQTTGKGDNKMKKGRIREEKGIASHLGRNEIETPAAVRVLQIDPIQLNLFAIDPQTEEHLRRPCITTLFDTQPKALAGCDFCLKKTHTPRQLSERLLDDNSKIGDPR